MEQRYATSPAEVGAASTEELRARWLVEEVFVPGELRLVYTHHDRIILGGAQPAGKPIALTGAEQIHAEYLLENRELGIVNVGGAGVVNADDERFELPKGACLYLGRGTRDVVFSDAEPGSDAQFYLFSAPAHTSYPSQLALPGQGTVRELGAQVTSNERSIEQFIHQGGIKSCQVVMGVTTLHPGSMWNTMPAHTHDRRTECYLYFDVPQDARVIHLCGEPQESRHLVVADRQAVISPSWSIHAGVGTSAYSFVWAMAGENQSYDDMDAVPVESIR
ncbi:4-deoxy-L-threo-5-hexosulose-uronate ketol-isomerase [Propionibacterium cyclohexanicum]|uniref:4-deoxy-L-threo-5-hexosulose-uronate ketol-isomerase n=1 Tax=Propionibacterium cyclohexanicum TaxID=64702 RepID=A0A1H9U1W6_9ACTN|nr:5-dehydro-4-deoxy-D-glucuronate isomerase [Propionibacterium cyclohexanicum]SES03083.1 4-deoxy-L-threo-5-hexosulose-uronate ketol-isomerase [Propionibacterium cyclohexanicum]